MRAEHLAREASRLLNDEVLQEALAAIRLEALEDLARADADDRTAILRLQAKVSVVEEFCDQLRRYITRGEHWVQNESPLE